MCYVIHRLDSRELSFYRRWVATCSDWLDPNLIGKAVDGSCPSLASRRLQLRLSFQVLWVLSHLPHSLLLSEVLC